jgi:hypothetical protein
MAKAIAEVAIGAALIGAAVLVPGGGAVLLGGGSALFTALFGAGASMVLSGAMEGTAELLAGSTGGIAVAVKNPIAPWGYAYGLQLVGGTTIYQTTNSNTGGGTTSSDKQLHRVMVLTCHPSAIGPFGTWQLRIDGKPVPLQAHGTGYISYSPTQTKIDISSISRVNGLVTMTLVSPITGMDGLNMLVRAVVDATFNCTAIVTQPNPADDTTFTYVCGGPDTTTSGGYITTTQPDYSNKVYIELLDGNHTSTFPTLLNAGTSWGPTDLCLGRTLAYIQIGYAQNVFPSSVPNVSFLIQGKNDILDPRTGTRGYTNNAALCIADYLSLPPTSGGFGLEIGTDIPTAQLIAGANLCDETVPLAGGGTIPRYTCNTFFQVNQGRGTILQSMLSSCAGRLSYQSGTYSSFPGAWVAPTLQLTDSDLIGGLQWTPRMSIRDTANACKGVYTSPEQDWQQGDVPAYQQDSDHGFATDQYLVEDNGERIYQEMSFLCTTDSATAQRLAKINLLRTRFQGRGTLRCSMKAYQVAALDVIQLTHPRYGWVNKNLEVLKADFGREDINGVPTPYVELSVAETDPSIYDWSVSEQLTPEGWKEPANAGTSIVSPPEGLVLYSGPGVTTSGVTYPDTVSVGADGIARNSMYVLWTPPNDAFVTEGGQIEIQYQPAGATTWIEVGKFHGATNSCFINNVSDALSYNVQIRSLNVGNYASDWVSAGPHIVSNTQSIFTSSTGFNSLGWTATQLITVNYSVTNSGVAFTWAAQTILLADGSSLNVPTGSLSYSGLASSTTNYTYWYINAATGALGQTNSNPPATSPSSLLAGQCSLQGRVPIPAISFTTLAATNTGSGSGTGGGGDTCPEAAEQVTTKNRGTIAAGDVRVGDLLKGKSFKSSTDVYRRVVQVRSVESSSWRMIDGHRVSPCEPVYYDGRWMPAYRANGATIDTKLGRKMLISIESDEYDEQNYYLSGDTTLLIHNVPNGWYPC